MCAARSTLWPGLALRICPIHEWVRYLAWPGRQSVLLKLMVCVVAHTKERERETREYTFNLISIPSIQSNLT